MLCLAFHTAIILQIQATFSKQTMVMEKKTPVLSQVFFAAFPLKFLHV